jgi:hypothetical protein
VSTQLQRPLVASTLPLEQELLVDQPHRREEPQHTVEHHRQVAGQVVFALDVDQFVNKDSVKLALVQTADHSIWNHDNRLPNSPYPRLGRAI